MMKKIFFAAVAPLLLLCSCGGGQQEAAPAALPTLTVELTNQTVESEYAAHLTGRQMVDIRPQVSGVITKICINEGDVIHKGQLLFVIDQVPFKAALDVATANVQTAQSNLATAQLKLQSNTELYNRQVISEYDLQLARNEVSTAQSALSLAKAQETAARSNLSYTQITSPVDGVAGMIPYHVGALVSSSIAEPLVTVSDDHIIYAYFSLSENQVIDMVQQYGSTDKFIQQALPVNLVMSNGQRYEQQGHIDAVSGIVDQGTGAITVRATFDNKGHVLRNGGSGRVLLSTQHDSCIAIPKAATFELQNRKFVYKVVADTCQSVAVEVSKIDNGRQYIVESGLAEGDVIVSEGAGLIREGTRVK